MQVCSVNFITHCCVSWMWSMSQLLDECPAPMGKQHLRNAAFLWKLRRQNSPAIMVTCSNLLCKIFLLQIVLIGPLFMMSGLSPKGLQILSTCKPEVSHGSFLNFGPSNEPMKSNLRGRNDCFLIRVSLVQLSEVSQWCLCRYPRLPGWTRRIKLE